MKMTMMMMNAGRWAELLRAADGGAGGGAGDPPPAPPVASDTPPAGNTPPVSDTPPADPPAPGKPWHEREGTLTGPERDWLRARGMLTDDPEALLPRAIRGHMAAEKALGKGADKLMDRPKEGEPVAQWLKANAAAFGIPDAPEGYEIAKPELPDGMAWDGDLEQSFRALAHEQGMTPDQVSASVGLFAKHMGGLFSGAATDMASAAQAMREELDRDWGDQYSARVALAQRAFQTVAAEAGIGAEQQRVVALLLKPQIGDAGIMRMFAAIGAKMGDDAFVGGDGGIGATTPQEAKAELQRFTGPDGEYGKAFAAKDRTALRALDPRREQLMKLASAR